MPDITNSGIRYKLKSLDIATGIKYITPNINNNKLKWTPIVSESEGIKLDFYNDNRNSVGIPKLEDLSKILSKY